MSDPTDELAPDDADQALEEPGWEDARPPHLPDRVTAIPPLVWVFVLLAIVDALWFFNHAGFGPSPDASIVLSLAIGLTWSVAACLMPAALLIRHRDAPTRATLLLTGTILFAVVQGMQILAEPLQSIFEGWTPASDDTPFLIPSAEVYRQAGSLIAVIGLICIGLGLLRARRYEDRRSIVVWLLIPVAAALAALTIFDSMQQIVLGDVVVTPSYAIFLVTAVVIGVLRIAAWAYLTAMASGGSVADEDPPIGWRLAALGGALVLLSIGVSTVMSLLGTWLPIRDNSLLWVAYAYSGAYALGHLCLLAGFALGLPALEPLEAPDDEAPDGSVDEDEFGWPVAGVANR